jgi:multiple RNA-binding domain-containing protein 1
VQHFKKCGPIHDVSVAKKKDLKDPRKLISLGYGFIQFKKRASTEKALKTLQQSVLNEHAIELKRSNRTVKYVCSAEWLLIMCSLHIVYEVNNGDRIWCLSAMLHL